jgi:hypothetical protein
MAGGGGGGYHVNRMAKILPSIGVVIVICDVFRTCHNIQGMHNGTTHRAILMDSRGGRIAL